MNIDKLLRKLEDNPKEGGKGHHKSMRTLVNAPNHFQAAGRELQGHAGKVQTLESIGTLNSVPDQHDQESFVVPDAMLEKLGFKHANGLGEKEKTGRGRREGEDMRTPRQSGITNQSKLDSELAKIDKMKCLYESRQARSSSQSLTKSIRKGRIGANHHGTEQESASKEARHHLSRASNSIEGSNRSQSHERQLRSNSKKHTLKPSSTPSFNKFVSSVQQQAHRSVRPNQPQAGTDSLCKNIYLEEFLSSSQNQQLKSQVPKAALEREEEEEEYLPLEQSVHEP